MIPGGIPRPGRMPTANQQRVMMEKLSQVDNSVRSTNGFTAASVSPDGIAVRDYEPQRILGKITGHGTGNRYSFVQVIQTDQTGTVATLTGGVTGSTTVLSAYEMNGLTTVPNDAIVELVPTWGANPGYGFIYSPFNPDVYTWDAGNGLTDLIYFADIVKAPANAKDIICDVLFQYTLEDDGAYDIAALIDYPVPTPVPIYVLSHRIAFAVQRTVTGVAADPTNDPIIAATDYIGFIETRIIPLVTYDPIGAPYDYMLDWGSQVIVPTAHQGNIHFSTGEQSTAYTYYLSYVVVDWTGTATTDNVTVGVGGIQSHILNYGTNTTFKLIGGDLLIANATNL